MSAGAVRVPEVWIVVTLNGRPVERTRLGLTALSLGSGEDVDVRLADAAVSRRHARFELGPSGVRLFDLDSKNGTWLGPHRVQACLLTVDARLRIGPFEVALERGAEVEQIELSRSAHFGEALGSSTSMRAVFSRLERVARTDESVLLLGESGTGKELLARALHDQSARSTGPFVVLDCAGLSPNLVEAELFGHARGAFTGALTERHGVFETASGGTVFIDEVGELPVDLQAKLLRVLQEKTVRRLGESKDRKVDVRVVSATHRPLARMIKSGGFRADLYYRLGVIEVRVPPLRERRDEIPFLVEQFLRQQTPPRDLSALPAHALALLSAHDWPGNVRELRSVVTRLMLFPEEGLTSALRSHPEGAPTEQADPFARFAGMPLRAARDLFVADLERRLVTDALRRARGNVSKAAAALGLSRQFLHRLLKLYGVERDED